MARDLSSAPVLRAIFETACCGIRLQIWRRTLNLDRVGLIACFFIPALWQGYTVEPTLFLSALWDGCVTNYITHVQHTTNYLITELRTTNYTVVNVPITNPASLTTNSHK